ncbi:MAG TPA: hypothetical protein VKV57_02360 [bacterium]|nr:hypothetical protein [bacterium]
MVLQDYEAAGQLLDLFARGEAGRKEAQAILARELPPMSKVFFEDAASEDEAQRFFQGDDSTPVPAEARGFNEVKDELRRLVVEAMTSAPQRYQRRLEPYGLAGDLIKLFGQHSSVSIGSLRVNRASVRRLREKWQVRVNLDDLPDVCWRGDLGWEIVLECALFEWAGWRLLWCRKGTHWIFAGPHRRFACRAHQKAGQQQRYRDKMTFRRTELQRRGFEEFVTVRDLLGDRAKRIPHASGVYVMLRDSDDPPQFLDRSKAGRFRGKDPTVAIKVLEENWVKGAQILYVGEARDLRQRVRQLIDFGAGKAVGHHGGRFLWQVKGADGFMIAWQIDDHPREAERRLIGEFRAAYGKRPFANLLD